MKIMIIAPHPDDAELAMGGTIFELTDKGNKVIILDLTNGEPTPHGSVKTRLKEARQAAKVLGVTERIILDLPNRYLKDEIEHRIKVAEYIRIYKPEIIFAPFSIDAHPDHIAGSNIALASRFYAKLTKTKMKGEPFYPSRIYFYFCSHLQLNIQPSFVLPVSRKGFRKKIKAIKCYKSQFNYGKNKKIPERIEIQMRYWGERINQEFAEPFFSYEVIGIKNISCLLI